MPWALTADKPNLDNRADAISQEFNLTSSGEKALNYVAGLYFLYQNLGQDVLEFAGTDASPVFNITYPVTTSNYPYNLNYALDSDQKRFTYAGFAQLAYKMSSAVNVTLGMRYTHDDFESMNATLFNVYSRPVFAQTRQDFVTGKGEIDVNLSSDKMVYGSVSRGFKPGGVSNNSRPVLVPLTYKAEHVWSYELGSKNRFGSAATLNMAAFFYDYRNLQYQQEDPVPFQGGVANVPKSHIWGAEVEGTLKLSRALTLDGNLTQLDGELVGDYTTLDPSRARAATLAAAALGYAASSPYTIALRAQQVQNTNGNRPPKLPKWQGAIGATHVAQLGFGRLRSRLELLFRSKFEYRIFNDSARDVIPSYTLVNANIELRSNDSRWAFTLSAKNIFDKDAIASRFSNPFGSFTTSNQYVPPREVTGAIKYNF